MADNVAITAGTGTTVAADEVSDGTLGTVKVQYVKIMDGTIDGTSKAAVGSNGLAVNIAGGALGGFSTVADSRLTVTTAGTKVVFSSNQACKQIVITALVGNTDVVVVGGGQVVASAGSRAGIPLQPNQQVTLNVTNLNLLYLDSVVNGEGVSYTYFN